MRDISSFTNNISDKLRKNIKIKILIFFKSIFDFVRFRFVLESIGRRG